MSTMTSAPDAELVRLCRQRDADAFRALVERHQRLVFAVALAHAGDVALAEDVAQEAFVAAWRPPASGGIVHVTYPFEFASSDGDER